MSKRLTALLLLLLAAGAGCKKDTPQPDGPSGEGKTTVAIATFEPPSIDPHTLRDATGAVIAMNMFEGLTTRTATGEAAAGAAERWTVSDDKRTWTFQLRAGLTWSDGEPLGAKDFVWSFRHLLDPATESPNAPILWPIKGAEPFNKGDVTDPATVGVRADGGAVVITLERPYPRLLALLATSYALPAPRHVVDKHAAQWTRPEHVVSNGAYVLASRKHGESLVLRKNARFHAAADVAIEEAAYFFTTDAPTAWRWYELGKIDWSVGLIPNETVGELKKSNAPQLRLDDFAGVFLLYMNATKPPFDDARVRRAIDLALDRKKLITQLLGEGQKPARSAIPPSMTKARPPRRVRHDPAAARKLLAEVGAPLRPVELLFNTSDLNARVANFITRNLKENAGLEVKARNLDWKTFLAQLGAPQYDMGQLAMAGFDAMDFLQLVRGDSPDNRARWSHAGYDALIRKAREAPTIAAQDAAIGEAMAVFDKEMPVIPVYRMTRKALVRPGLTGYEATSDNMHPLRWMRWMRWEPR